MQKSFTTSDDIVQNDSSHDASSLPAEKKIEKKRGKKKSVEEVDIPSGYGFEITDQENEERKESQERKKKSTNRTASNYVLFNGIQSNCQKRTS